MTRTVRMRIILSMPIIRAQVTIPRDSNIAADVTTNVFHFSTINALPATLEKLATALVNFYKQAGGAGENALVAYLSAVTNPAAAIVRMWNLDDPKPRVPVYDSGKDLGISGGTALPSEVALVGTYQADKASGVPQARRRGRIFLGPLSDLARDGAGNLGRPNGVAITALNLSMSRLAAASEADADWNWVVYSAGARDNSNQEIPYKDRPLLAPEFAAVTNGWVDNAFDTQRRRGEIATAKTAWT